MMRERWPNPLRSSGANQRALRSASGVFLAVMGYIPVEMGSGGREPRLRSALQAPLANGLALDCSENQVLDHEADGDDRQEACEHGGDIEQISVLKDEP